MSMLWVEKEPRYGDVIRTKVRFYYHYGIFVSEEEVIQFGLPDDPSRPAEEVRVLTSDIHTFLQGGDLQVLADRKHRRSPEQTVNAARQRLGEGEYHILHNNCEHFAMECAFGHPSSSFLDDVRDRISQKLKKKDFQ